MATIGDAVQFKNISATTASFTVQGGYYCMSAVASSWGSGSTKLCVIGPDGATLLSLNTLSSNGVSFVYVPPGECEVYVSGVSGLDVTVARIPLS